MLATLSAWNSRHLLPIGSCWEVWVKFPCNPYAVSDGIMKVDKLDKYTCYFTYGYTHKNPGYESRLMGSWGDYLVDKQGKRIIRKRKDGCVVYFTRVADRARFHEQPARLPVCENYACECKIGPIAHNFPASYC